MSKPVVLLERPAKRAFNGKMRGHVERLLRDRAGELPVPITARWHKSQPLLRLDSKYMSWEITFGPETVKVVAMLSAIGRFLDTKKTRAEALATLNELADEIGI